MQLNWLCSSSGTMLIGDASLQKPIGFALGIAVNSSALLCKAGQQQLPVAEKGGWELLGVKLIAIRLVVRGRLRITGSAGLRLGPLLAIWAPLQGLRAVSADGCLLGRETGHILRCSCW